jgi:hypothetical protein
LRAACSWRPSKPESFRNESNIRSTAVGMRCSLT